MAPAILRSDALVWINNGAPLSLITFTGTMYQTTFTLRVRYAEVDAMNVVYHGNYAQYLEAARAESIRQLGFTYKDIEASGVMLPIVEWNAKFIRPAHYDDLLTIKTYLKDLPDNHKIEYLQEVYNEAGKLLANFKVVFYFIDIKNRTKTTMPEELRRRLLPYFTQQG